jgi:hypothetical protein
MMRLAARWARRDEGVAECDEAGGLSGLPGIATRQEDRYAPPALAAPLHAEKGVWESGTAKNTT